MERFKEMFALPSTNLLCKDEITEKKVSRDIKKNPLIYL